MLLRLGRLKTVFIPMTYPNSKRVKTAWDRNLALVVMCAAMIMAVGFLGPCAHADQDALVAERVDAQTAPQPSHYHTVTGTLSHLDLKTGKGMLKTDLGKPIFFDLVRPDLFQSVSVGQHVSIVLNEQGQAVKVMDTPPAEVLSPGAQ